MGSVPKITTSLRLRRPLLIAALVSLGAGALSCRETDRGTPRAARSDANRAKALNLTLNVPDERPFLPYPDVGHGKRIIYANDEQRVWLVDENNELVDTYLVSGREDVPRPGTYEIVIGAKGYRAQRKSIRVLERGTVILNVELHRR